MHQTVKAQLKSWFASYVHRFATGQDELERNVALKAEHTHMVCAEIRSLGEALGLAGDDLDLAEVCALFHDIGRFEQYRRWQTFVDALSVDHAALGCRILREEGILRQYLPTEEDLILRVIAYHNRARLPVDEDQRCLFFSRLLRDADKLDIYRVVTGYYRMRGRGCHPELELGLPDLPEISDEVVADLMAGRIVDITHLRTLNDFKLLQAGWVYDINFSPTLDLVVQRGYLRLLEAALPDTDLVATIFGRLRAVRSPAAEGVKGWEAV